MDYFKNVTREDLQRFITPVETSELSPLEREHSQFYHSLNISNDQYLYFAVLGWFEEGKSPEHVAHLLCDLTPPADLQQFGGWYFPHVVLAVRELAGDFAEL